MSLELFSIIVLLVIFVIGTVLPINLGLMSFVAAFSLGTLLGGLSIDDVYLGFPGDLFILLAGVTFLFAIAQSNGTVDLLTDWGVRLVRGNIGLIPWVMFALTALLTSVGALAPAAVAIVAPIALRFAAQHRISPLLMGLLVVQGATAGAYSPINFFGAVANGVLNSEGLPQSPGLLYLNSLVFNGLVAAVAYFAFGGLGLLRRQVEPQQVASEQGAPVSAGAMGFAGGPPPPTEPAVGPTTAGPAGEDRREPEDGDGRGLTPYKGITLAGLVLLVALALGFDTEVGPAAFTIALVLVFISPRQQGEALRRIPWSAIVLITGIVTYVSVLEQIGTFEYMQGLIDSVGSPVLAALAASYVGGVISAFASTTGILGAIIPLAAPILDNPGVSSIGVVTAIALSSAVVDASPFSTSGALVLANGQGIEERKFFRQLLAWGAAITLVGPLVAWLAFVVIGIP